MLPKFCYAFLGFCVLALGGCDLSSNYLKTDREANAESQEYRDAFAPRIPDVSDFAEDDEQVPELQPYIASLPERTKPMPLVSISVNQTVPLRDVLYELAEQAEYDLELDPNIRGSIIFTARNKPFDVVIDRITEMAGLRYTMKDDVMRVEIDRPYNKTYKIDYLSYVRTSSSSVRNDIAVVSGEGADTGSSFQAASESEADFWGELQTNLTQILAEGTGHALRTASDPRISVTEQNPTEQNPEVEPVAPPGGEGGVNVQPPDAVLRVDALPVEGVEADEDPEALKPSFAINKQAGLITVFAPERLHKQVQEYLLDLKRAVSSQVLIEAKILEVSLNDRFAAGIDWRYVNPIGNQSALNFLSDGFGALDSIASGQGASVAPDVFPDDADVDSVFVTGIAGSDIQGFVEALTVFGTVRALASPRITVLNNQAAALNVATNRVFFEIDIDITEGTDGEGDRTNIDSEIRNVPEGVLVNVQPSINLDENTVSLALRPTVTRVVDVEQDPAVQFVGDGDVVSEVPVVNVQEIDSVIKVRSGQPVVMGGLLQDEVSATDQGVPVLSEVPMFGALFKDHTDQVKKTELVVLLKATIVPNGQGTVHNTDKDLYRRFSSDRRPFKL